MKNVKEFLKPQVTKLWIFCILILFSPSFITIWGSWSLPLISEFSTTFLFIKMFYNFSDILYFAFILFKIATIYVLSCYVGKFISNKTSNKTIVCVFEKSLLWCFATLVVSYTYANYLGSYEISESWILIAVLKFILVSVSMAFILEYLRVKTKNNMLKYILLILLIFFFVFMFFNEVDVFFWPLSLNSF